MTAATSGPARAEEYLRLLAETALRRRDATGLHAAALALADNDLLAAGLAEDIVSSFGTATAIRLPENAASEPLLPIAQRMNSPFLMTPGYHVSPGRWPPGPGRPPDPVTVADVSTRIVNQDGGRTVDLYLLALVRTPRESWLSVAAHSVARDPRRDWRGHDTLAVFNDLSATDEAGNRYELRFGGYGHDRWANGQLYFAPDLRPDVAWLEVRIRDSAPTRLSLAECSQADLPQAAAFTVSPLPLSRPERYVQALAEAALAAPGWRPALIDLAAATSALLAAGALRAESRLPGQVARLCARGGLPADDLPDPAPLPGRWASLLAAYPFGERDPYRGGDRHPPPAVARLAIAVPAVDGARIALTALVSRGKMTELYGSFGTNMDDQPLGSCWVRDDSGQWHAALPGGWSKSSMRGAAMTSAALVPPVPPSARSAEIVISGATTQARATVPLAWWAP